MDWYVLPWDGYDLNVLALFQAQVAAYTQWVNIQLKRRPGSRPIEDLQRDMQDGVALAHLIEIIGLSNLIDWKISYN